MPLTAMAVLASVNIELRPTAFSLVNSKVCRPRRPRRLRRRRSRRRRDGCRCRRRRN